MTCDYEWHIIRDDKIFWQEANSIPEDDPPASREEDCTSQKVDIWAINHILKKNPTFSWLATDRPLKVHFRNIESLGMSIHIFVWGVRVGFTNIQNFLIKELKKNK